MRSGRTIATSTCLRFLVTDSGVNATNNIAKFRLEWGLRIDRSCLCAGFSGCTAAHITLFLDVEQTRSAYRERKQ